MLSPRTLLIVVAACGGDDGPANANDAGGDASGDVGNGATGWAKRFGGFGDDEGLGLALDPAGNVYLVGSFSGRISFRDGELFEGVGSYVASLTPDGTTRWARELSSTVRADVTSVAVGAGVVHVAGSGAGLIELGGAPADAGAWEAPFHARYDLDGAHQVSMISGQRQADGANGYAHAVAVGADGATWISGQIGQQNGAATQFGTTTLTVAGGSEGFLAAFAPNGSVPTARTSGDNAMGIAVTSTTVTTCGVFIGTLDLGAGSVTAIGGPDMLVASFELGGAHRWSYSLGSGATDYGYAVVADGQRVYASGTVNSSAVLIALDDAGNAVWERRPVRGMGSAIAVDGAGNVYLAGRLDADATVGTTALTHAGGSDAFVISYTAAGDVRWAVAYGSTGHDKATGIVVDPVGHVFVTGSFERTVDFGGTPLDSDQTSTTDVFVLRLDPP